MSTYANQQDANQQYANQQYTNQQYANQQYTNQQYANQQYATHYPLMEQPVHSLDLSRTQSPHHLPPGHFESDERFGYQKHTERDEITEAAEQPTLPADVRRPEQRTNFYSSVPWPGLLSILLTVLLAIAIIIVIFSADGKPTDSWPSEQTPVQLAVVLAVLVAVGNATLTIAFNEGATLTWWLKMVNGGTLDDSHRYWQHGSSVWQSLIGLGRLNKITPVSILLVLLIVSSPLIQRAAHFTTVTETETATFTVALSPDQLNQPTAYYMTRAQGVSALSSNFSQVLQAYTNRDPIKLDLKGCKGSCSGSFVAAGFDVSCTRGGQHYELKSTGGSTSTVGAMNVTSNGVQDASTLTVFTMYKPLPAQEGKLTTTTCKLHSAQVRYPFSYVNGTITLEGASDTVDGTVNRTIAYYYPDRESVGGLSTSPSLLGGIANGLNSVYSSEVQLYSTGNFAIQGKGPMVYTYMNSTDRELGKSNMTWSDPTPAILEAARELTFRAAVAFSTSSSEQTVQGTQQRTVTKYKINTAYLGGTLAIIFVCTLAVLSLYYGFWRLGRQVSMSPLEIATAFQAPATRGADTFSEADMIAKQVGNRDVKYSTIYLHDGAPSKALVSSNAS